MKKIYLAAILISTSLLISCKDNIYRGVPREYRAKLDIALNAAGDNSEQLIKALEGVPRRQREAMAFLISYMPERDLTSLTAEILIDNVTYAFKAKEKFPWARNLPKDIFFNEVLPFTIMDETRESWRGNFFERFSRLVEGAPDIFAAIDSVNLKIRDELLVDFDVRRRKPHQSPFESIELQMASCTGLSILLTAAFRSVGIPSRIAGTPNWYDRRGNHNWSEVWINGVWYFTEYYPDDNGLNHSWFLASAGMADETSEEHAIFATSFRPTGQHFPLAWDRTSREVHAVNVTQRYIELWNEQQDEQLKSGDYVAVRISFRDTRSTERDNRIAVNVRVFDENGQDAGRGQTSSIRSDWNQYLTLILRKNHDYTIRYSFEGQATEYRFRTGETTMLVELAR